MPTSASNSARFGADGKPRPGKGLRVTLVREHRDYHWNWNDDGGWDYDFNRRYEDIEHARRRRRHVRR